MASCAECALRAALQVLHALSAQPPLARVAGLPVSASCLLPGVLLNAMPAAPTMPTALSRCVGGGG